MEASHCLYVKVLSQSDLSLNLFFMKSLFPCKTEKMKSTQHATANTQTGADHSPKYFT